MTKLITLHGSGGGGDDDQHVPTESPDTLQSRSYAKILDLLCEGEIKGVVGGLKGVYLDDTPVQNDNGTYNFSGFTFEQRVGQQTQTPIDGFTEAENEVSVGVTVKRYTPVIRTIENTQLDALCIKLRVPVLTDQKENGDIVGTNVQAEIRIKNSNNIGFSQAVPVMISGKTTSPYERQVTLPLKFYGPGPWTVKVTRITPDSELLSLNNDIIWSSYTEIIYAKLSYPNTALVGLKIDAEQFQSIPSRSYDVEMAIVKVPSNYDTLNNVHIGFWDGTFKMEWTDNPAWCYYDMVTNPRYGLGGYIDNALVDKWELYQIAKYCDELVPDGYGGQERRFTLNAYFDTREQALKLLNDLTSVFRSMLYWSGESLIAVQDAPQDISYLFTESNVIDGRFTYESSARKTRATSVVVQWSNPDLGYEPDYEYVEDVEEIDKHGLHQEEIMAIGTTSRGQAHRFGLWYLYTGKLETQIVTFATGAEGLALRPGTIIGIQDRNRSGAKWGGRIVSLVSGVLTLDREVTLDPSVPNYINLMTASGTPAKARILPTHGTGSVKVLTISQLTVDEDQIPPYAIFTVSNQSKALEQARIVTIEENEDGTYNIAALIQHPGKFDLIEKGIKLEDRGTVRSSKPDPVSNLTVGDSLYIDSKIVKTMMFFDWEPPSDAVSFDLKYRRTDGNWVAVDGLTQAHYEVPDVLLGEVEVWVRAVNVVKKASDWAKTTGMIYGKTRPPEDVKDFTAELSANGVELRWSPVSDLDLAGYEVRVGDGWDGAELVDFTKSTNTLHLPSAKKFGRTITYFLRAKDTSLNYSSNVATVSVSIPELTNVSGFQVIQHDHQITFHWNPPATDLIDYWEIRSGEVWASGALVLKSPTPGVKQEWLFTGDRVFWIKAFDIFGFESDKAVFYNLDVTPKVHVNVVDLVDYHTQSFPGTHPGLSIINTTELRMLPGVLSGEYNYEVELLKSYRCTLLLDANIRALSVSGATWKSSAFPWNSEEAAFPWAPKEDLTTLTYSHRIAIEDGSGIGTLIDSFPLDASLTSWNGVIPLESHALTYAPCRLHEGVRIAPESKLLWPVNLPGQFAVSFNLKLEGQGSSEGVGHYLLGLEQAGAYGLELTYDSQRGLMHLTGQSGEEILIPFHAAVGQVFSVGIMQNAYFRTLALKKIAGDEYVKSVLAAPGTGFNRARVVSSVAPLPPQVVAPVDANAVQSLVNAGTVSLSEPEKGALQKALSA